MRQSDVIDSIRAILIGASIEASPENYAICHRFVTQSDANICAAFKAALGDAKTIDAAAFGRIKDQSAPLGREAEIGRQTSRLEEQLTVIANSTREALGHTATYSQSLTADASRLGLLEGGDDISAIVANLLINTKTMAERSLALEASLQSASAELSTMRAELDKARRESATDVLTALPNRRAFESHLHDLLGTSEAERMPVSLAFFDIDHFKAFNDRWGHQIGDHVLRFVGAQMATQFKETGIAARFGGEEFVLLLPGFSSVEALQVVKTFCDAVSGRVLRTRSDNREIGRVTLSAGVASLRRGETAEALIERADMTMYAAKQAGRNRVLTA